MPVSYDEDVVLWAEEQARLIRARRFDLLDIEHIADEVEDVGKSEKRELAGRLAVLLAHLFKWQHQPERRGASWQRRTREQRKQMLRGLRETPSIRRLLSETGWMSDVWGDAVTQLIAEASFADLPEACPFAMEDVLTEGWLPG